MKLNKSILKIYLSISSIIIIIFFIQNKINSNESLNILAFNVIILFSALLFIFTILYKYNKKLKSFIRNSKKTLTDFDDENYSSRFPGSQITELDTLSKLLNNTAKKIDDRIKGSLQRRRERIAVLASMSEAVLAIDLKGHIIILNASGAKLFDLDDEKSIGESIFGLIRNSNLLNFFETVLNESNLLDREITFDNKIIRGKGSKLLDSNNEIIGAVIVFNDITKIKKLENIRKEFVANVSHELKTPVTTIKGYVETIQGITKDVEQKKFLKIVSKNTNRLNSIIDDLLLLSKIEEKEDVLNLDLKDEKLKPVLESAKQNCDRFLSEKNINIKINCLDTIYIKQNHRLLEEAIFNILNNSIKYSNENSLITIDVINNKDNIEIKITDQGIGIDKKHLDRLFERFYRVDESRSRDVGGTGLGLSIVKHIIKMHNGKIKVDSVVNKGTIFTIIFSR
tara:strand:+ start:1529 stop:2890 length:1362 start_codon:yes stop_codon:yes gene_type:complete